MQSLLPSQLSKGLPTLTVDIVIAELKKRRYFTLSILSWVVIAGLTVAVVVPQVKQVFEELQILRTKQSQLGVLENRVTLLRSVDPKLIQNQMDVLTIALPPQKPVLPLLYSLDKLAAASQVSIGNYQISPGNIGSQSAGLDSSAPIASQLAPGVFSLPLKMDIQGTFANMNTFFKTLDAIVPLVHVTSIQFAPESSSDSSLSASSSAQFRAEVSLDSLYAQLTSPPKAEDAKDKIELTSEETSLLDQLTTSYQARQQDTQEQTTASGSARTNFFKL